MLKDASLLFRNSLVNVFYWKACPLPPNPGRLSCLKEAKRHMWCIWSWQRDTHSGLTQILSKKKWNFVWPLSSYFECFTVTLQCLSHEKSKGRENDQHMSRELNRFVALTKMLVLTSDFLPHNSKSSYINETGLLHHPELLHSNVL